LLTGTPRHVDSVTPSPCRHDDVTVASRRQMLPPKVTPRGVAFNALQRDLGEVAMTSRRQVLTP